jgi:hypothetical protein
MRRSERERAAAVVGECGTGKTLVALAAIHCHADGKPYTALAMVPGHLTAKMARETFQTLPRVRVFFIDALRDGAPNGCPCGINEVKLHHGKIVREGFHTTLTDLRLRKNYKTARQRWYQEICSGPALFIVGRDRSKLGWFWRHVYEVALDLLSHPSLIFYESGYSLHTLRQASRRSWRIGQWQPVRVYYRHYEETVQTSCLLLMGKKLLVSLAMEGKFSGDGLQALDDGDDMLTAMARELVTERGIGEPADAVWRQIQAEQAKMLPAATATVDTIPSIEDARPTTPPATMLPSIIPVAANALKFGSRPIASGSIPRKRRSNLVSEKDQLALF